MPSTLRSTPPGKPRRSPRDGFSGWAWAFTLALAVVLPGTVYAEVLVRHGSPAFSTALPDGFLRYAPEDPPPDLLGCYRRGDLVMVQLVRLRAAVPQRPLAPDELTALRRSDPTGFAFTDTPEHARALGFEIPSLAGHAQTRDGAVVRLSAAVPLWDDGLLVTVLAPGAREPEARRVFRDVLAALRGRTRWRTPGQRTMASVARWTGRAALGLTLGYVSMALAVFRGRRDLWRAARGTALWATGALWGTMGVCLVALPERPLGASLLAMAMGAAMASMASRALSRRR